MEAKFHMESNGGTKVYSNGLGHMIKTAAMLIYGKNKIKTAAMLIYGKNNLLLRNQKADNIETWYAASGARVLPNLFK